MKQEQTKKLLPELVITAAILYGLWTLMISPLRESLSEAQAAHANVIEHTRITGDPALSAPRLNMVKDGIDDAISEIEQRSEIARDQTALQADLMKLGAGLQLQINRVSPAKAGTIKDGVEGDRVVSFEIECTGRYRDVVSFVAVIEQDIGLSRVDRISLRPDHSSGSTMVRARLSTKHYAFDISPSPTEDEVPVVLGGSN